MNPSPPLQELLRHTLDFCNTCLERGDLPAAQQALNRAHHLSPQEPEILSQRGRLALLRKQFDRAGSDFAAALRLDEHCAMAHSGLARFHLEQGCRTEAETAARRALVLDPADEDARDVLSDLGKNSTQGRSGVSSAVPHGRNGHNGACPAAPPPVVAPPPLPTPAGAPSVPTAESANGSRAALNRFHANASDYFTDVAPPPLTDRHLQNSRLVPSRNHILPLMPKGGVCAEVGTQTGGFAKLILSVVQPSKLHIYDIDYTPFDHAYFEPFVAQGTVELHRGDSSTLLSQLPDRSFDFIYIDGDHSYEGVAKDLAQAARKIKNDGWIVCNDYTIYSPLEKIKYGVYRAVNELCLEHDFEILYLGLHVWGYHDVALRKRSAGTAPGRQLAGGHAVALASQAPEPAPAPAPHSNGNGPLHLPTNGESTAAASGNGQSDASKLRHLAQYVGDDWKQQPYYDDAEKHMEAQWRDTVWPFIKQADFNCVLDLAAGHGRNSERLGPHARKLYVVDINQENIDFCRRRFAGDPKFVFLRNDGCSLPTIAAGEISLVYCFDAMVHFDSDVVRAYLREFHRVLRPGGLGFCHHSNYTQNPGGDVHKNPGWRNFMSQKLFAHYCAKEGLTVLQSRLVDWTGPESDCVTLFRRA